MPNITEDSQVLLFVDCVCVEHYPFGSNSSSIGLTFGEQCDLLGVTLPIGCRYAFYRFDYGICVTLKEHGLYHRIIISNSPKFHEQNSKT